MGIFKVFFEFNNEIYFFLFIKETKNVYLYKSNIVLMLLLTLHGVIRLLIIVIKNLLINNYWGVFFIIKILLLVALSI